MNWWEPQTINGPLTSTLDGSAQIKVVDVPTAFPGVGGFMNCSKPGGGEDASAARNFLPDLKPNQIGTFTAATLPAIWVTNLIGSVGGPDAHTSRWASRTVNPWRYNSSNPTNNPGSYDLWIQLVICGNKPTSSATGPNKCRLTARCPEFFMCVAPKSGPGREHSIAVDWRDCAWSPRIVVQFGGGEAATSAAASMHSRHAEHDGF